MGFYTDAVEACESTAEPMGDFWGAVYGGGALLTTGSIGAAAATSTIIDHTVTEGTGPMCHLGDSFFADDQGAADVDGAIGGDPGGDDGSMD